MKSAGPKLVVGVDTKVLPGVIALKCINFFVTKTHSE